MRIAPLSSIRGGSMRIAPLSSIREKHGRLDEYESLLEDLFYMPPYQSAAQSDKSHKIGLLLWEKSAPFAWLLMDKVAKFGDTTFRKVFVGGLAWETRLKKCGDTLSSLERFLKPLSSQTKTQENLKDTESVRRDCAEPNPVIDGRGANCNVAALGRPRPSPPVAGNPYQRVAPSYSGLAAPFPPPPSEPPPVIYPHYRRFNAPTLVHQVITCYLGRASMQQCDPPAGLDAQGTFMTSLIKDRGFEAEERRGTQDECELPQAAATCKLLLQFSPKWHKDHRNG
ncbi:hypothetical protein SADUNF_Sadunf05G0116800 [Salix dunnii]|uniref:Uncharacterized protein n=1 Tax=Salix dunnii TaxID=1413687 RepID=A0A835KCL2_9ROSI|nr:hypothetical protein SADUNF_Sadunf05G0116800 [Salix dunnii]